MMSDIYLPFEQEELSTDVIDLEGLEMVWCLKDPTEGIIDSLTDFDDIDDMEKLLAKERAFLESL